MARGPAHWFKSATRDGLRGHGAPRPPIFVWGTIRLGTPAVSVLRGPRSFSQLLERVIQDAPSPTRSAFQRRGLGYYPSATTSRKVRCIPYISVGTTDTPWIWGFSYTLDGPSFSERFITVGSLEITPSAKCYLAYVHFMPHDGRRARETHRFWVLVYTTHGTQLFQKRVPLDL